MGVAQFNTHRLICHGLPGPSCEMESPERTQIGKPGRRLPIQKIMALE